MVKTGSLRPSPDRNPDWYMPGDQDSGEIRVFASQGFCKGVTCSLYRSLARKVPAGRDSDAVWATIDFMPTILSLAGVSLPDDRPIDGQDQTNLLLGKSENGRSSFVYDQVSQVDVSYMAIGIRKGKWKLLLPDRKPAEQHRYVMDYGTNDYELYDLDTDIGGWNLAYDYPEIVEKLEAEIGRFKATVK